MEEVVRAFNWVIEKGWVRSFEVYGTSCAKIVTGLLLGDLRMECP